jgi:hypothetical protein
MTGALTGNRATTAQLSKESFTLRVVMLSAAQAVEASDSTATVSPARKTMPNPSIERTNNGGSQLRASANAQPPLFASHLKR